MADTRPRPMDDALGDRRGPRPLHGSHGHVDGRLGGHQPGYRPRPDGHAADDRHHDDHVPEPHTSPGGDRAAHYRSVPGDDLFGDGSPEPRTPPGGYRAADYSRPDEDDDRQSVGHRADQDDDLFGADEVREPHTPPGGYRAADYWRGEDDDRQSMGHRADRDDDLFGADEVWKPHTPPGGYRAADYWRGEDDDRQSVGRSADRDDDLFGADEVREPHTPPGGYRAAEGRQQIDHRTEQDDDLFGADEVREPHTPPGGYRAAEGRQQIDHRTEQDDARFWDDDEVPERHTPPGGYRAAEYRRWEADDVTTPEPEPAATEPLPPGAGRAPNPPPAPAAAPALLPPSPPVAAGVAAAFAAGLVAALAVLAVLRWPHPPEGGGPLAALDASVNRAVAADRVLSVATWVENVATLLVVGGACFRLYVSRPAVTGRGASESTLVAASLLGIAACVLSVPLRAMVVSGRGLSAAGDLDALGLAATSRFGDAACVRLLALVLFAVALARPPQGWGRRVFAVGGAGSVVGFLSVSRVTLERVACSVAGLVALASFTFVGHPQASRPRGFLLVSQAVHVTAAAVWFGGGALLAMEIHRRWRHDSPRAMAETIERFSTLAGVSVALVAISGVVLAHSQLASPEALVTSPYGRALLAKLAFVGLVAAIGGYNHSRLVPAVVQRRDTGAWRYLGWTAAAEGALIAGGVLVMTAAMTSGGI